MSSTSKSTIAFWSATMAGRNKLCFLIFLGLFCLTSSFKVNRSKTKLSQRLIQNEHQDFSDEESMSCLCLEKGQCGKILNLLLNNIPK